MASDTRGSDITAGKQDSTASMQYLTEQGIFDARNHSDFAMELTHPGSPDEEPLLYGSNDSNVHLHQDEAKLCKSSSQQFILAEQAAAGPSSAIEESSKHLMPALVKGAATFDKALLTLKVADEALVPTSSTLENKSSFPRTSTFKALVHRKQHQEGPRSLLTRQAVSTQSTNRETPLSQAKTVDVCLKLSPGELVSYVAYDKDVLDSRGLQEGLFKKAQDTLLSIQDAMKSQASGPLADNEYRDNASPVRLSSPLTTTRMERELCAHTPSQKRDDLVTREPHSPSKDIPNDVPLMPRSPCQTASSKRKRLEVEEIADTASKRHKSSTSSTEEQCLLTTSTTVSAFADYADKLLSQGPLAKIPASTHTKRTLSQPNESQTALALSSKTTPSKAGTTSPNHNRDSPHPNSDTPRWACVSSKARATFETLAAILDEEDDEIDELASDVDELDCLHDLEGPPELQLKDILCKSRTTHDEEIEDFSDSEIELIPNAKRLPHQSADGNKSRLVAQTANIAAPAKSLNLPDHCASSTQHTSSGNNLTRVPSTGVENESGEQGKQRDLARECITAPTKKTVRSPINVAREALKTLSTEDLAAVMASKRQKSLFVGGPVASARMLNEVQPTPVKRDFANINGYLLLRNRHDLIRETLRPVSPLSAPTNSQSKNQPHPPTKQAPLGAEMRMQSAVPQAPVEQVSQEQSHVQPQIAAYDLRKLAPAKCFGSFRLLQNTAIDRALDMHNIEVIYPDDPDPVAVRALKLSTTGAHPIFAQIRNPDLILSSRSCLFYYRLSYIYRMTTVLNTAFQQTRVHHSKILLDALKLLSERFDKITLVFEAFEPTKDLPDGDAGTAAPPKEVITPPVKKALEKLHSDIGTLIQGLERRPDDDLEIEILYATNAMEAAAFARERLEMKYAKDVHLGSLGYDNDTAQLLGLNDLSAHHVIIESGSLDAFQVLTAEERRTRFADSIGPSRLEKMNNILRARNNFGSLNAAAIPPQAKQETRMKEDNNIIEATAEMFCDDTPKQNNWQNDRQNDWQNSGRYTRSTSPIDLTAPQYQSNDQYHIAQKELDGAIPSDFAGMQQDLLQCHQPQLLTHEEDYNYDEMDTLIFDDGATIDEEGVNYYNNSQLQTGLQDMQSQTQVPMQPFTPVEEMGPLWSNENVYEQTEMQFAAPLEFDAYGEVEDEGMVHEFDNYNTNHHFIYEGMEGGF